MNCKWFIIIRKLVRKATLVHDCPSFGKQSIVSKVNSEIGTFEWLKLNLRLVLLGCCISRLKQNMLTFRIYKNSRMPLTNQNLQVLCIVIHMPDIMKTRVTVNSWLLDKQSLLSFFLILCSIGNANNMENVMGRKYVK